MRTTSAYLTSMVKQIKSKRNGPAPSRAPSTPSTNNAPPMDGVTISDSHVVIAREVWDKHVLVPKTVFQRWKNAFRTKTCDACRQVSVRRIGLGTRMG